MILNSTESSRSLGLVHTSKGAMGGHHVDNKIACLLQLHDNSVDFFSISLILLNWWPNHKIGKREYYDIYLIKLLLTKQNMEIK